ncbi:MAG: hypothetical protein JRJ60_15150, partial [Deltaproteobacteria bacterium]|nr:hypothetical protein [Deltaproteobacteria bacterium]
MKKKFLCSAFVLAMVLFFVNPSMAIEDLILFGKPLSVMGYVNQGVSWGIEGDEYDTKKGFQSAIFQFLLEGKYEVSRDLRFFGSGMLNLDWAYDINDGDDDWEARKFDQSSSELHFLSEYEDILRELHVTWTPGNWSFRLGKQVVSWGETDLIRLADQINPLDQRRGFADVEFESSIMPIWLAKAEYYFDVESTWLLDLGIELVFNPNADFIPKKGPAPGNDVAGIWTPYSTIPLGGPFPFDFAYFGSMQENFEAPDSWDSDGFEYGVRIRANILDSLITLLYFNGVQDWPVMQMTGMAPFDFAPDSRFIAHPQVMGYYPDYEFVGFTLTRDFENLYISALGGVAPVLRLEALYGFDSSFMTPPPPGPNVIEEHDEFRWAVGIDWKVKIPILNPRAYFFLSGQFIHHKITDYPSNYHLISDGLPLQDDNYMTTIMIN